MTDPLVGYDMVVSISQNEINSQFQRLFGTIIKPEIVANGLSKSGGPFGGGELALTSYIRGYVDAPQVQLATETNPYQVVFFFTFKSQVVTSTELGVSDQALQAAFAASPDGKNGLLIKTENIPYGDGKGATLTLANQRVCYWLTREQTKLGTTTIETYSCVPALYYLDNGNKTLIMLDGLQLSFQVMLNMIPTTAAALQAAVSAGTVSADLLAAIKDNNFDSQIFSLEQLFLDFDTTDFTQWSLKDPAAGLGATVTGMSIGDDGSFTVGSESLQQLLTQDPSFSTELSTNLQYAFGMQGENSSGRSSSIIGVGVGSSDPAKSNPDQPASLVPTYIGYSTSPNANQGLSCLTYQILGGTNPQARVPMNHDGTVVQVSTDFITTNDYSGEMLFSRSAFFESFLLAPLQQALNTQAPWTQDGASFSSQYAGRKTLENDKLKQVYQDDDDTYQIQLSGNVIAVSGNLKRTITIQIESIWTAKWWKVGTLDWSLKLEMYIDQNQQLAFKSTPDFPAPVISSTQEDAGAKTDQALKDIFLPLSELYFNPFMDQMKQFGGQISQGLQQQASNLNHNLLQAVKNNFISPTGQVFLLNGPRFNTDFDLQMDVTYSV